MKTPIFTGSGLAMITPMNADGSVNYAEIDRILEDQLASHTDVILSCGTTGEASTLDDEEHLQVIGHVVKRVNGRIPVIAGTGSNNTAHAVMMSKGAADLGADALLVVTPYYNKTSQAGLIASYTAVADATELPVIMYNVPSRTGVNIAPETARVLSACLPWAARASCLWPPMWPRSRFTTSANSGSTAKPPNLPRCSCSCWSCAMFCFAT